MTALIARQYIDGSKADTPSGVSVANFQLGLGNAWDCLQTLGVGLAAVVAGTGCAGAGMSGRSPCGECGQSRWTVDQMSRSSQDLIYWLARG